MEKRVRVRFAPSPTGGLHIGGVRTVLFNYLFARHHNGDFILRIEDTDQNRFVAGAEDYIRETLHWCGLTPDESPWHGGSYGPYRQSQRKEIYRKYAEELVQKGHAYYAFDTPEELDEMRKQLRTNENKSQQYDRTTRTQMRNSLTLAAEETKRLLAAAIPHVIRIKVPENETVILEDMIRGKVEFDTSVLDDKVLLKADGMPTYHLAVVVDDHLMEITHAFRGEEWLPSAPVHLLLWRYLFGEENMPQWAHLPLILGPEGKLSKRDGAKYGFPVFAMNWTDPKTGEHTEGFRERGFLPEAFVNLLAMLGWNDGTEQELFTLKELVQKFSIEKVHKGGAHFDFEKAKWFNHEWIKRTPDAVLGHYLLQQYEDWRQQQDPVPPLVLKISEKAAGIAGLIKERCTLLTELWQQASFFFTAPQQIDFSPIHSKWSAAKKDFFTAFIADLKSLPEWKTETIEAVFKEKAEQVGIKPGELQLPLRLMLVGGKFGPPVFEIAALLGDEETSRRIENALAQL